MSPEVGIIAAALIAQVLMLAIMCIGSFLIAMDDRDALAAGFLVLAVTLLTVVPLMLSSGYAGIWAPLFGGTSTTGISRSSSMVLMFVLDILTVSVLVWKTGGSLNSPFQALYFLLPSLAIFLREPVQRLLLYLILVATSFTTMMVATSTVSWYRSSVTIHRMAYWFVAVACFVVATYIGYLTRPVQ